MKHRKQGLKILPHSSLLGGSIAANGKVLCAVGDFGNGTFNLAQKPDSSTNVQLTTTAPYCTKHVLYAGAVI